MALSFFKSAQKTSLTYNNVRPTCVVVLKPCQPYNFSLSGSKLAAGYDLHSAYDYEIAAHGKVIAKTDLQIRVPDGTYGRIAPRSGLAAKHFIDIGAGVVDQDYT